MSMDKDIMQYVAQLEEQEQAKIQEAINKIDSEADKMKDDTAVRITSYIIDNYITSVENAEKVMNKTLSDCISNIRGKAQKQAKKGYAMIENLIALVADERTRKKLAIAIANLLSRKSNLIQKNAE